MRILELFSGTASFSKVATARGHDCRTLDYDPRFKPTYCMDIMDFQPSMLGDWKPDVIWASPDCRCFSIMVVGKNWIKNPNGTYAPRRPETIKAIGMVEKTLSIIREIAPDYWVIENPRAMLRKMLFMAGLPRRTITYCQYGTPYQKATDIWTNLNGSWNPKPPCSASNPCSFRDKEWTGEQHRFLKHYRRTSHHPADLGDSVGWGSRELRGGVPLALCAEILDAIEAMHSCGIVGSEEKVQKSVDGGSKT